MKTSLGSLVLSAVIGLGTLCSLSTEAAESCAKAQSVQGSSCDDLKVELDLSSCGGKASQAVKIVKCGGDKFSGEVKSDSKLYSVAGSGAGWGGRLAWKVDTIEESTAPVKPIKSKVSKAPPQAPAPAPMAAEIPAPTPTPAPAPQPAAVEKKFEPTLTFNGDIRQRFEQLTSEAPGTGKESTYRQWRLRARAGVKAQPTPDVLLEFRLATGPGGVSTNQSYGDSKKGFRNYDFLLDRGSAQWSPIDGSALIVGRMANPYVSVGENDLIYDSDLNFDGISLVTEQKFGSFKLNARGGTYVLSESKDVTTDKDINLNSAQLMGTVAVIPDLSVSLQAAFHQFENVKDHSALLTGDFGGNSNASSLYSYDYQIASFGGEISGTWKKPITLYYEYVMNTAITADRDGKILGLKVGKLKAAGDWSVSIDYRELKKDAVFGITTDGDSFGGGTDGYGVRTSGAYAVSKSFNLAATLFNGSKYISGAPTAKRDRIQIDLNFKF